MDTQTLTTQKCVPCEGNVQPFTPEQVAIYAPQVPDWQVLDNKKLAKEFTFKNFGEALDFINKVGAIAEEEGHHPDIFLHSWNKVTFTLWTHVRVYRILVERERVEVLPAHAARGRSIKEKTLANY